MPGRDDIHGGTNGSDRTAEQNTVAGIALDEALLREKTRCVLNSARMLRGIVTVMVVSLVPWHTESRMISALY
jgi:hypothetical protein